jgi:hypothetical protein
LNELLKKMDEMFEQARRRLEGESGGGKAEN